ncbi:MAG: 4-hydroxy-tetrahydrodipicolinate synthase [Dehalococcoidia bacterium]|nr:4-hydroxy-tetrahydrodipicolinate synthase [Dehalococcoidia bacterium]
MKKLGRLLTAMITPFDAGGAVDYQQARKLARGLLDSGSDGLIISGTTGEAPTLTMEEKLRLFAEIKDEVADRGVVVAGTGSNSTRASQELTMEAEKIGVDACLLVVPYYNKPSQEGLYQHFRAIAGCTSLPCIVYNVPSRTVTSLAAETTIRLSRIENVVGVKEASGNMGQIAVIVAGVQENFLVYSGNDSDTFSLLALGGYGVISVASHIVGMQIRDMIRDFLDGRIKEAVVIHRHLLPLISALFVVSNPTPVKYVLNYLGFPVGRPRLPLTEPDDKSAEFIRETLKDYRIDFPLPDSRQSSR